MFCPNCGTEVHDQAAYCSKCRKNVTYITTKPEEGEEAAPKRTGRQSDGFYCNHCGNFVLPIDNYCFECGKKTQKDYYTKAMPAPGTVEAIAAAMPEDDTGSNTKKYTLLGIILLIMVIGTIIGYFIFSQAGQ